MNRKFTIEKIVFCCMCLMMICGCSDELPIKYSKFPYALKSDSLLIEASDASPRRSEGAFIKLKNGSVLAVYTRFTGGISDYSSAVLSRRISTDNGISWNEESDIVANEGLLNVMSVSLLRLQNDSIAMFYLIKNSEKDCYPVMRTSGDEGQKWSEIRYCQTPGNGYHVLNNSRVIQLNSGRILLPVAWHDYKNSSLQSNGTLFCLYSDDNGLTWQKSARVPKPSNIITQEPGVVELKNGEILMYIRTASGFQYYSYSLDAGKTWLPVTKSSLRSAQSPALIVRNPYNDLLVAVWNDSYFNKRTPLCLAVSDDEGQTWKNEVAVENDINYWFCYPALLFLNPNTILLSYSVGLESNWGFGALKFSRISSTFIW